MISQLFLLIASLAVPPSWTVVDSGLDSSIRGISAVDAQVCWIGTKSGVARTTDAGETWSFTKIGGDELDFRDLHAFDAQHCVAMSAGSGEASKIYRSSDGGKTWKLVFQNTEADGFFNGIAFMDGQRGILAGDPVGGRLFLLATSDGGESWQRVAEDAAPQMVEGEHAFAASGTHLCVDADGHVWVTSGGARASVFRSEDFGQSWTVHQTPMIAGQSSTGIFSITFSGQHGVAVGGDYQKESERRDNAMRSRDGGVSWELIRRADGAAPFEFRSCVGFVSDSV
ncbi:MAG: WD40/YVTN/BNR-like repeat-containing protein, partial [Verrucomicrobiales bacterium]